MTIREAWRRMLGALGLGPRDRDLSGELAFHRDMFEEQFRARGMDGAAARREARLALGGEAQIAEHWRDQRSLPFFDTLRQDVRYGLRMLRRTPGFTAAALTTLALGIGANTAIFSVIDAVLLRPLPFPDADRLVTVGERTPLGQSSNIGFATMADWRERSRSFEQLALMRTSLPTLVTDGEAERLQGVRVSGNYFDMMRVRPALGRGFTMDEDRPDHRFVAILSDSLWRRRFGADPSIVGRTIVLSELQFRVVGVMPPSFEPLDAQRYFGASAEIWIPLGYDLRGDSSCYSCRHLRGFGRLKPGVTVEQATVEMNAIHERVRQEHPNDFEPGSVAIVPLHAALTRSVRPALLVLMAAVAFVLLIACANVANLLLARAVARGPELALRASLGADRRRIVRQLLTESALLSVGGGIAGVLVAAAAVRGLEALAPVTLPRLELIAVDGRVLLFSVVVALLTGLVFGLLPAWRAGAADARQALALDSRGAVGGRSRSRAALVVVDLALALVLLASAGLMLRTVAALATANPGFTPDGILSFQLTLAGRAYQEDAQVLAFQTRLLEKLRALPGVESAALADEIPFGGNYDCRGFHAQGRMKPNPQEDPCIQRYGITSGYLRLMKIPVLAGRDLLESDTATSQPVMLISQGTAREVFGADNPIGAQVRMGGADSGPWRTIVGVVGDVHHSDVTAPVTHAMYVPESQFTDSLVVAVVKAATADPSTLAPVARAAVRELDASVPVFAVATLPELLRDATAPQVFVTRLLAAFAAVAVLLAAIGLYGVVAYGVARRTREVGVRIALGAKPRDVLRLVLGGGFALVALGVAAGLAAAFAATRVLDTLVYGVSPFDPITFAGATVLLMAVALLAHWVPVRRALRIDPAIALRAE
jgi:putative ABC transport system permease protein